MPKVLDAGSLWELAVLCLLREAPMHPYQMQRLLRDRHKEDVLDLKPGSLYHAIRRLARAGLIAAVAVGREGRRPERTTYRLTPDGEQERTRWLRERIATPHREPPELMGSLSFAVYLAPRDVLAQLEKRAQALEVRIAALAAALGELRSFVSRINLIESEYLLAMHRAELEWVRGRVAELRGGRLAWDLRRILRAERTAARRASARRKT